MTKISQDLELLVGTPVPRARPGGSRGSVLAGACREEEAPHTLAALSLPQQTPPKCLHRRAPAGKVWILRGFAGGWRFVHAEHEKNSMPHLRRCHLANLPRVTRRFWTGAPSFRRYESLRQCRIKSGCSEGPGKVDTHLVAIWDHGNIFQKKKEMKARSGAHTLDARKRGGLRLEIYCISP